jgi:hypothetical protein
MPLLTATESINAAFAETARQCALHIASAASLANQMVSAAMALPDDELTAWLNSKQPAEMQDLFAAHGTLGTALNAAAAAALPASGVTVAIPTVDVRSVAEKLASNGRVLVFTNGTFSVTTPPPVEPEP